MDELAWTPSFLSRSCQKYFTGVRFHEGERIFAEGDVGRNLYIIRNGTVEVSRTRSDDGDEEVLGTLGPGSHFGEVAVFEHVRRTATVRAKSRVELLCVSQSAAIALSESSENVGKLLRAGPGRRK